MQEPSAREVEHIVKAFANRRRIAIVKYLKREKEASVGDIAREIKVSFKATSRHLKVLSSASIIEGDQRSLQVFYKITSDQRTITRSILTAL